MRIKSRTIARVATGVLITALTLSGCSAASTINDLKIDELKGIDFGQTKGEVVAALGRYELRPEADSENYTVFDCDGLVATYDAVKFSPRFLFDKKGKLKIVNGLIINSEPALLVNLETYLEGKFGKAQVKDNSKLYSDGGVKVVLSTSGSATGAYNFISFKSPDL